MGFPVTMQAVPARGRGAGASISRSGWSFPPGRETLLPGPEIPPQSLGPHTGPGREIPPQSLGPHTGPGSGPGNPAPESRAAHRSRLTTSPLPAPKTDLPSHILRTGGRARPNVTKTWPRHGFRIHLWGCVLVQQALLLTFRGSPVIMSRLRHANQPIIERYTRPRPAFSQW